MKGKTIQKQYIVYIPTVYTNHFLIIWIFTFVNMITEICNNFTQKSFVYKGKEFEHMSSSIYSGSVAIKSILDRFLVRASIQFLGGHRISGVPQHGMWICPLLNINTKRADYNPTPTLVLTGQQSSYSSLVQIASWKVMDFSLWELLSASKFMTTFCITVYHLFL